VIGRSEDIEAPIKVGLISALSDAIGIEGLCAGQERDLRDISQSADAESLKQLQYQKTGALFVLCLETGARIAGLEPEELEPLRSFGAHAGLGFQILDDLLDAVGDPSTTGKDHGSDTGKQTHATIMTVDEAEARADQELTDALAALEPAGIDRQPFAAFLNLVLQAYHTQIDLNQPTTLRAGA
jgi:geranylgeranyl pyrophosphate synthase